ncbi:Transcription initiation protein spt3 [Fusarium piperis]|uniref:Transcription initiation protein spt3 n=1 Tax=Fusarium piperis TaxID=1435070 RepID=A0A9W8TB09_9HYPO|nr:Transcription initiation protein spt3 [Fusarium piperis]
MPTYEPQFKSEIQRMMYIAGETQDPSVETIAVIEEIIRDQVVLMLTTANELASRRGARFISNADLFFQIRHDPGRLGRLLNLLRWNRLRLKSKAKGEKGDAELAAVKHLAEVLDVPVQKDKKNQKPPKLALPWDVESYFSVDLSEREELEGPRPESNKATVERLRRADQITRRMTAKEYTAWAKSRRRASFSYRKKQKFREFCGFGVIAEHEPKHDCLDILSFLACEMVQSLTETALAIQENELRRKGGASAASVSKVREGLFTTDKTERESIGVEHVREAFQVTQTRAQKKRPRLHGGLGKTKLQLI